MQMTKLLDSLRGYRLMMGRTCLAKGGGNNGSKGVTGPCLLLERASIHDKEDAAAHEACYERINWRQAGIQFEAKLQINLDFMPVSYGRMQCNGFHCKRINGFQVVLPRCLQQSHLREEVEREMGKILNSFLLKLQILHFAGGCFLVTRCNKKDDVIFFFSHTMPFNG